MAVSGRYRREKRYMDTWAKWMAFLGLAILAGGACALGFELTRHVWEGFTRGYTLP